jgi:hypothetical protein
VECFAPGFFARSRPIEVRSEASHKKRPASSQNHGHVNILGAIDDALFQHPPHFVCESMVDSLAELLGGIPFT